ncbi:MAG TPA: hypothetical protein VHC70_11480 [Phycisphaerales bacterium]|jgi:hypothetical protein|nr:hypothetical protein [Phycisphaerales bacterium]
MSSAITLRWIKRLGAAGFVFFLVKGLVWLALVGGIASLGAGSLWGH